MSTKRSFPLNNPFQEKAVANAALSIKTKTTGYNSGNRGDKGVSKGGKEGNRVVEALVRCEMCGEVNKIVCGYGKTPQWHRCISCGELQPMDGYRVIMYGSRVPTVLSAREVKAHRLIREREET